MEPPKAFPPPDKKRLFLRVAPLALSRQTPCLTDGITMIERVYRQTSKVPYESWVATDDSGITIPFPSSEEEL